MFKEKSGLTGHSISSEFLKDRQMTADRKSQIVSGRHTYQKRTETDEQLQCVIYIAMSGWRTKHTTPVIL